MAKTGKSRMAPKFTVHIKGDLGPNPTLRDVKDLFGFEAGGLDRGYGVIKTGQYTYTVLMESAAYEQIKDADLPRLTRIENVDDIFWSSRKRPEHRARRPRQPRVFVLKMKDKEP